jgi:UDP-glucose 4-epimerase
VAQETYIIVGGAGFIGSHFTDYLLGQADTSVVIYDNFTSGQRWHLKQHDDNPALRIVEGDVHEQDKLTSAMQGVDTVIHLASNPDIAKAMTDPDIDFREGTQLTRNVVEAMRSAGVKRILYASGSGVYGDLGNYPVPENHGPLLPISTYGASKLAGEALICSYAHMFEMRGRCFRFANVVGPRQTHGVAYDFIRRLKAQPGHLDILGDGTQSKSYVHVSDIVAAVMLAHRTAKGPFEAFNVGTATALTVTEIADLACEILGLKGVEYRYGGGNRGWKGDVPVVRIATDKIRALGWTCQHDTRQAVRKSIEAMLEEIR